MSIEIVPITRKNLDLVAKAGSKWGMPRSVGWLERCMFDPTVEDLVDDECRGHMAVNEVNEPIAIQGYYYMPGYFRQKKILINTGCIMGSEAKYGEELICCLDENQKTNVIGTMTSANCIANAKSAKVNRVVHRMKEAPKECRERRFALTDITGYFLCALQYMLHLPIAFINFTWVLLRPISWFLARIQAGFRPSYGYTMRRVDSFMDMRYKKFWEKLLAWNDGLMVSRSPERMAWLFDASINAGNVGLVAAEMKGEIRGYVLIRRMPKVKGCIFGDFQICDICALDGNVSCLKALAWAAVSYAGRHGGRRVLMYGALPNQANWLNTAFCHKRIEDHATFMYVVHDTPDKVAISQAITEGKGWFFGPLDGERCLGYGGYVDY